VLAGGLLLAALAGIWLPRRNGTKRNSVGAQLHDRNRGVNGPSPRLRSNRRLAMYREMGMTYWLEQAAFGKCAA